MIFSVFSDIHDPSDLFLLIVLYHLHKVYADASCHQRDAYHYYTPQGRCLFVISRGRSLFIPQGGSLFIMLLEADAYYSKIDP